MLKHEIPYQSDSSTIFARIADKPWAVYLDSGQPDSQFGHYDIMVADPFIRLVTNGEQTEIFDSKGLKVSSQDPFNLLKATLAGYQLNKTELPFEGGAIGYFAYDLARQVETLPNQSVDSERIPQMMVGVYDWVIVVDHRLAKAWLVSHMFDQATEALWPELCALFDKPSLSEGESTFEVTSALSSNMDYKAYTQAFDKVKQYIYEGDCYQVNLAQRFSAQARGDAWVAYQALRDISPAPFMAYMNLSGRA
jgi:para-aminobenzoate synthetase component 1